MKKQGCDVQNQENDDVTPGEMALKSAILELVMLASARFTIMPSVASAKWPDRQLIDDPQREADMYASLRDQCVEDNIAPETVLPFLEGLVEAAKQVQHRCFDLWEEGTCEPDLSEKITAPRNELDTINKAIIELLSRPPFQTCDKDMAQALFLELSADLSLTLNDQELIDETIISLIMNGALKAFLR